MENCTVQTSRKRMEVGPPFSLETTSNIHENSFKRPETIADCNKRRIWNILRMWTQIWRQNWFAHVRQHARKCRQNTLLLVELHVKPKFSSYQYQKRLFRIVFIFVCYEETDFYRVECLVDVSWMSRGDCSTVCRLYCGRIRDMQTDFPATNGSFRFCARRLRIYGSSYLTVIIQEGQFW